MGALRVFTLLSSLCLILLLQTQAAPAIKAGTKLKLIPGLSSEQLEMNSSPLSYCGRMGDPGYLPPFNSFQQLMLAVANGDEHIVGQAYSLNEESEDYALYTVVGHGAIDHVEELVFTDPVTGREDTSLAHDSNSYSTYIDVFDDHGNVTDSFGPMDRLLALYDWSYHRAGGHDVIVAETFLDGWWIFDSAEHGKLRALVHLGYAGRNKARQILLLDIDQDYSPKLIVWLSDKPSVSALCPTGYLWLPNCQLPTGEPVAQLTFGVVVVELDGASEMPFTYYPVLELK